MESKLSLKKRCGRRIPSLEGAWKSVWEGGLGEDWERAGEDCILDGMLVTAPVSKIALDHRFDEGMVRERRS